MTDIGYRQKGHLIDGLEPHNAAAQEAHEEAGVIGEISKRPIGAYRAQKIRTNGQSDDLEITLYSMRFVLREADWPEKGQRAILWFDPQDAARAVREAGLSRLLSEFRPF